MKDLLFLSYCSLFIYACLCPIVRVHTNIVILLHPRDGHYRENYFSSNFAYGICNVVNAEPGHCKILNMIKNWLMIKLPYI